MLIDEFIMTRKLLKGAAMPNHGDVRTLESTPSAKLSITFKLKMVQNIQSNDLFTRLNLFITLQTY